MSFLSSIFGGGYRQPPEEKWDSIISTIHFVLANERKLFFEACLEILEAIPEQIILNRAMTPSVELGILIYQLHLARELIAAKQYVRPENGTRFMNKLYWEALQYGTLVERDTLMKSYWIHSEAHNGMLPFYGDLVQHISGEPDIRSVSLLAQHTGVRLGLLAKYSVAIAFGDKATIGALKRSAEQMSRERRY